MIKKEKISTMKKAVLMGILTGIGMLAMSGCGGDEPKSAATAGTAATPATTSGTPQTGVREIKIIAKDNMFDPKTYNLEGAGPVKLTVVNEGEQVHEVEIETLLPETKLSPGQNKVVDLPAVQPRTYRLYCEIHEDQGMEGEFIVK
jgi:plastocyanin